MSRLFCLVGFHRWGLGVTDQYPYPRVCCLRCGTQI